MHCRFNFLTTPLFINNLHTQEETLEGHKLIFHPQVILDSGDLKDYDTTN